MGKREFTKALTDLTVTSVEAGYRAGLIAGLREAAVQLEGDANFWTSLEHPKKSDRAAVLLNHALVLRAHIAALEEEGTS